MNLRVSIFRGALLSIFTTLSIFAPTTTLAGSPEEADDYKFYLSRKYVTVRANTYRYSYSGGEYKIFTKPSGVAIAVNGEECGTTPLVIKGLPNSPTITFSKEGYETLTTNPSIVKGNGNATITMRSAKIAQKRQESGLYSYVSQPQCGLRVVRSRETGKYGYINGAGDVVLACIYDRTYPLNEQSHLGGVSMGSKKGLVDSLGRFVLPIEYHYTNTTAIDGLIVVREDPNSGRDWAVLDYQGNNIFNQYFKWGSCTKGLPLLLKSDDDIFAVLISGSKELKWLDNYDDIYLYDNNTKIRVHQNGKYGLLDRWLNTIVETQYDALYRKVGEELWRVRQGDYYALLDPSGRELFAPRYNTIFNFEDDLAVVVLDGKRGVINIKGDEIIAPQFEALYNFREGRAVYKSGDRYGVIDYRGELITYPIYKSVTQFSHGLAAVRLESDKLEYIDSLGTTAIASDFNRASMFNDRGIAAVQSTEGVNMFINTKGESIDSNTYEFIGGIEPDGESPILVKRSDRYQYIGRDGKALDTITYQHAFDYAHNVGVVMRDSIYYLIDNERRKIPNTEYLKIDEFKEGNKVTAAMNRDHKIGFITTTGQRVGEFVYDNISKHTLSQLYIVKSDSLYGATNLSGRIIVPVEHDLMTWFGSGVVVRNFSEDGSSIFQLLNDKGNRIFNHNFDALYLNNKDGYNLVRADGKYFATDGKHITQMADIGEYIEFNKSGFGYANSYVGVDYVVIDRNGDIVCSDIVPMASITTGLRYPKDLNAIYDLKRKKFLYIDGTGKRVLGENEEWIWATEFDSGVALVTTKDKKNIYINSRGREALETSKFVNSSLKPFKDGEARVQDAKTKLWHNINTKGKYLNEVGLESNSFTYTEIIPFDIGER